MRLTNIYQNNSKRFLKSKVQYGTFDFLNNDIRKEDSGIEMEEMG